MAAHDRKADPRKGRVKRLYDRLAAILWGLRPDRRQAFGEYLNEQEKKDRGRNPPEGDPGQR
jgi:hypothetical protein